MSKQINPDERLLGEEMLPLLEWSMADLNVPVYPEIRVYKQVTREICKLATNKNEVALIIKDRPTIFSGRYKVTRTSCSHLERPHDSGLINLSEKVPAESQQFSVDAPGEPIVREKVVTH